MTEQFAYKGFTLEIGDLPGVRQAYWKIADPEGDTQHQVECGDITDLRLIAMRCIDNMIESVNLGNLGETPQPQETHAETEGHEEQEEAEPETEASAPDVSDSDETVGRQRNPFFKRTQ